MKNPAKENCIKVEDVVLIQGENKIEENGL